MIWYTSSISFFFLTFGNAFQIPSSFSTKFQSIQQSSISSFPHYAKAPTSQFDLEAIEAYEKSLLEPTNNEKEIVEEMDENEDGSYMYHIIPPKLHKKRIDAALAELETELSRSTCGNLVSDGFVSISMTPKTTNPDEYHENTFVSLTRKSEKVLKGQIIKFMYQPEELPTEIIPENIPLNILYEDEYMIVVNKAAGMVVHPAAGNWDGTLVNALAYYLANESPYGPGEFVQKDENSFDQTKKDSKDGEMVYFRPGIVHRLDKGTTGIIVVAKTKTALTKLSESFANRKAKKTYLAITVGNPGKRIKIDKPIGRHPIHRQRMRVVPDPKTKNSSGYSPMEKKNSISTSLSIAGRRALSYVDTKAFDGKLSVVEVKIETGRTHQIRVHLQDRHTPIYGDDVYGLSDWNKILSKKYQIERPLLHAYRLEIDHPISGERMIFNAPMADDMTKIANIVWPQGKEERPELFLF